MIKLNGIWIGVLLALIILTIQTPRTGTTQPLCDMTGCVSAQDMERLQCYTTYPHDPLRIQTDPFYRADTAQRMVLQCGSLTGIVNTAGCLDQQIHSNTPFSNCARKTSNFINTQTGDY